MSDTATAERTKPTRRVMIMYLAKCTKKAGWMPESARLGWGTWLMLADDFQPYERAMAMHLKEYHGKEDRDLPVLDIAGVPFVPDLELEEGVVIFESVKHPEAGDRFDGLDYVVI